MWLLLSQCSAFGKPITDQDLLEIIEEFGIRQSLFELLDREEDPNIILMKAKVYSTCWLRKVPKTSRANDTLLEPGMFESTFIMSKRDQLEEEVNWSEITNMFDEVYQLIN